MAKPSIGFAKCVMWGDDLKIISKIAPHLGVLFLAFLFRLHFNLPVMIKIDVFFRCGFICLQ